MTMYRLSVISLLLATTFLVAASPASAGCGGGELTLNFEEIKSDCGPRPLALTTHDLEHGLDHHAADPDRYDPADVIATKINLAAFEEMAGAVRRLVTRAERETDPTLADDAFRVAETTFRNLPIAQYLTLDDFLEENRNHSGVVVPFSTLVQYLKDLGTPDDLVEAVEDAGRDC